ncbi:hypothetical protein LMG29739_06371 [Paraburkholderia solisilvae]|uniref:Uncharacterized protein n=1 Tax=Paraburkholderia solisilvae TaxID=624376 RepID=A0A6J5F418_9BURK|nr:hypothetical protein LMG29739_06371 [Paraburkholderia solisilvae]
MVGCESSPIMNTLLSSRANTRTISLFRSITFDGLMPMETISGMLTITDLPLRITAMFARSPTGVKPPARLSASVSVIGTSLKICSPGECTSPSI